MPDLLFLAQRIPYPPDKGEKIRAFHILRHLARRFDVHLGCLLDDPADLAHVEPLRALCRSLHVAPINRSVRRWTCLRGLLSGEALSVAYFRDRQLAAWVRDVVIRIRPAVTIVSSSNMAPIVLDLPRTPLRIADLVDVDSEKWHALAIAARWPLRLVYRREAARIATLEQRIAGAFDRLILVSHSEEMLFAHRVRVDAGRVRSIGNGVDARFFDPALAYAPVLQDGCPHLVFTGTMDYPPNEDAVEWFADEILPLIRRTVPSARFVIVGSRPGPRVRRLGRRTAIVVTGRVADVRPYLAGAAVAVAPMRIARGIQNKVLEAMAMGRPVVATPGTLDGINAQPGREVFLARDAATFAAACCEAIRNGEAIGRAARARVVRDHDWDTVLGPLHDVLGLTEATTAA